MTNFDVVKKLIGNIDPVADAAIDCERFENLKDMCELMKEIHIAIDYVAYHNKNSQYGSQRMCGEYADKFLTSIGIKDDNMYELSEDTIRGLYLILSGIPSNHSGAEVRKEAISYMNKAHKEISEIGERRGFDCRGEDLL